MKKTILGFFTMIIIAVMLFPSCVVNDITDNTTEHTSELDENTNNTTDIQNEPKSLKISDNGVSEFTVIRSDNASEAIIKGVSAFGNRVKSRLSKDIKIDTDFTARGAAVDNSKFEILIGATNRQASIDLIESLSPGSFGIRVTDNKIVIAGTDDSQTAYALYAFEDYYLYDKAYNKDGVFSIPVGTEKILNNPSLSTMKSILSSDKPAIATISSPKSQAISGYSAGQGATTDGTYFYNYVMKKSNGKESGVIVKKRMTDWSIVKISKELPLDHGNDMCFNSKKNLLVITNMTEKRISFIDPETLEIVSSENISKLPGTAWSIAYHAKTDRYVFNAGGNINIADGEFNIISSFKVPSTGYTGQGMDADDDFIYIPQSASAENKKEGNIILICSWEKGYIKTVSLDLPIESETMMNYDGRYYMNFNVGGGYRIAELAYTTVYK